MMSIRTRCPLGSVARAVLVVPSFRPPPFFSPRKNHHHHLYYPFFPLFSPLVVSHLITPRRKPLRHLSMRPIRRRRSSTRVSFPVARTSDFFDRCFPTSPFFPRRKRVNNCSFARRRNYSQEENKEEEEYSGGSLVSFSLLLLFLRVFCFLSLSLSLLQREEKKRKTSFFWRDYFCTLVLFEKTLSSAAEESSPTAKHQKVVKKREKHFSSLLPLLFY